MPMNIDDNRFEPIVTEGNHPRRTNDLEVEAIPGVEGVAGSLNIIAFSDDEGMSYEQTEPVGERHHRYRNRDFPTGTVRPA